LIGASFGSLAVAETKPQRIGPRRFSPLTEMMVSTIWLGPTLRNGLIERALTGTE
jgi:hypothetical protein